MSRNESYAADFARNVVHVGKDFWIQEDLTRRSVGMAYAFEQRVDRGFGDAADGLADGGKLSRSVGT